MELLTPSIGLVFWTAIVFGLVYFALKKFVWPSILQSVNERETGIAEVMAAADKLKAEMALLKKEAEALLSQTRKERERLIKEGHEAGQHIITQTKNETKARCDRLVERALQAVQQEKQVSLASAMKQVEELAAEASEKLLRRVVPREAVLEAMRAPAHKMVEEEKKKLLTGNNGSSGPAPRKKASLLNHRFASRYARSLLELARETNQLEAVTNDLRYVNTVCQLSSDFMRFLKDPHLHDDEKNKVIEAIFKDKIVQLTKIFLSLLVQKNREAFLVQIIDKFLEQYNAAKGLHIVKLTTAVPVSDQLRNSIIQKVCKEAALKNIALEWDVDENLIGGFVLEYKSKFVDASLRRGIRQLQQLFDKARPVAKPLYLDEFNGEVRAHPSVVPIT